MPYDAVELEDWQKTLLKAAEIVRAGWWHGQGYDDGEKVCVYGAIGRVCGVEPYRLHDRSVENGAVLALLKHLNTFDLVLWNDAPGRTAEEVASVMESVAFGGK